MAHTSVIIEGRKADEIMTLVRELRARGLVQGVHFDFKYSPGGYKEGSWDKQEAQTEFKFYEGSEKYATFFTLQYVNK